MTGFLFDRDDLAAALRELAVGDAAECQCAACELERLLEPLVRRLPTTGGRLLARARELAASDCRRRAS